MGPRPMISRIIFRGSTKPKLTWDWAEQPIGRSLCSAVPNEFCARPCRSVQSQSAPTFGQNPLWRLLDQVVSETPGNSVSKARTHVLRFLRDVQAHLSNSLGRGTRGRRRAKHILPIRFGVGHVATFPHSSDHVLHTGPDVPETVGLLLYKYPGGTPIKGTCTLALRATFKLFHLFLKS
jgi:hypothetical protein